MKKAAESKFYAKVCWWSWKDHHTKRASICIPNGEKGQKCLSYFDSCRPYDRISTPASARTISQRLNQAVLYDGSLFNASHLNHAIVKKDFSSLKNILVGVSNNGREWLLWLIPLYCDKWFWSPNSAERARKTHHSPYNVHECYEYGQGLMVCVGIMQNAEHRSHLWSRCR